MNATNPTPQGADDLVKRLQFFAGWLAGQRLKHASEAVSQAADALTANQATIAAQAGRIAELEEALQYYVTAEAPEHASGGGYYSLMDDGHVARNALQPTNPKDSSHE